MVSAKTEKQKHETLTFVVGYVITAAWAVSFIVDIVNPKYDQPTGLTPLMLIVAGACFSRGKIPMPWRAPPVSEDKEDE